MRNVRRRPMTKVVTSACYSDPVKPGAVGLRETWVAPVRRAPDVPAVRVEDPLSPGGILQSLFLKWKPTGKNAVQGASAQDMQRWLKRMVEESCSTEGTARFVQHSREFGWRLLALMTRFGIRVQILDGAEYRKRQGVTTAGRYWNRFKTAVFNEEYLTTQVGLVHHEMGHALDHLISALCLQGNCCSTMLWHGFKGQRQGFVTDYAQKNPREYFAESVEAYFRPDQRWLLQHQDAGMHAFLQALFELSRH